MAARGSDGLRSAVQEGRYRDVLASKDAADVIRRFMVDLVRDGASSGRHGEPASRVKPRTGGSLDSFSPEEVDIQTIVGTAALNAFLQANVTGPVLEIGPLVETSFLNAIRSSTGSNESGSLPSRRAMRRALLKSLDVDGVSVYQYIPHIELFCLARYIFTRVLVVETTDLSEKKNESEERFSLDWMRLHVYVWHYRLITQPTLGPGSTFTKSMQWTDVPTLQEAILTTMSAAEKRILWESQRPWPRESKVAFLLEKANVCIILGRDVAAKEALAAATEANRFAYALSGALGKRTRFQEKSTSQLVVLARSAPAAERDQSNGGVESSTAASGVVPDALPLNDDTVLESIDFSEAKNGKADHEISSTLPSALRDLVPDEQPQLSPLDQIVLLTEATLKDAFSPIDSLTSEEILPYAVRVISDKPTNWQIYSQALLVRSRIEVHRSRTVERGVLQMQAVVDQVVVDTSATAAGEKQGHEEADREEEASAPGVPAIEITAPEACIKANLPAPRDKSTSFFPSAKPQDSAPAQVRLRYIDALSSPPRWHLESELAYAWAGVGSLVSALEIFKRLRLWAEVALCLASSAAADDDGRGSGGEEKAKAILRWRLFHRTADDPEARSHKTHDIGNGSVLGRDEFDDEDEDIDTSELNASDYMGLERSPPPPNAPRLFCILGEIECDPSFYERAWELSGGRYARAQRSLAEHYLQSRDWGRARDAYRKAVAANRLSPDMWSRLGDINLRLGTFEDAAEAYGRAIGVANDVVGGEDARTWSNLGSSLYSLYCERVDELKREKEEKVKAGDGNDSGDVTATLKPKGEDEDEDDGSDERESMVIATAPKKRDPAALLSQSLAAYKRGASIAHDNWRIWDNVITLASRIRPLPVPDIIMALRNIITARKNEEALDDDILRLLLAEVVLSKQAPTSQGQEDGGGTAGEPARGSPEKAVCDLLERDVVPLITNRSELWELVARERTWRRDFAGAIDAAEKAWRAATSGGSIGGLGGGMTLSSTTEAATTSGGGRDDNRTSSASKDWLVDEPAWETVVKRTDELVSLLENFGGRALEIGERRWRTKARSAVRSVMSRAREAWEGSEGWTTLEALMEGLKA